MRDSPMLHSSHCPRSHGRCMDVGVDVEFCKGGKKTARGRFVIRSFGTCDILHHVVYVCYTHIRMR